LHHRLLPGGVFTGSVRCRRCVRRKRVDHGARPPPARVRARRGGLARPPATGMCNRDRDQQLLERSCVASGPCRYGPSISALTTPPERDVSFDRSSAPLWLLTRKPSTYCNEWGSAGVIRIEDQHSHRRDRHDIASAWLNRETQSVGRPQQRRANRGSRRLCLTAVRVLLSCGLPPAGDGRRLAFGTTPNMAPAVEPHLPSTR
jgi:hypothetical protein